MLGTDPNVYCLSGKRRKPSKHKVGTFSSISGFTTRPRLCRLQTNEIKALQPCFGFILYNGMNQRRMALYLWMKITPLRTARRCEI